MRMLCRRSASLIRMTRDVLRHRHDHLAVVLGLGLLAALELDPRQLRDALDELRDLVAELGRAPRRSSSSVSSTTSCRSAAASVSSSSCSSARILATPERVVDEVLAGAALLALVRGARRRRTRGSSRSRSTSALYASTSRDQLVEELLVALTCLQDGHGQSVLPGFWLPDKRYRPEEGVPGGRTCPSCSTAKTNEKPVKLARLLASLDDTARLARPAPAPPAAGVPLDQVTVCN